MLRTGAVRAGLGAPQHAHAPALGLAAAAARRRLASSSSSSSAASSSAAAGAVPAEKRSSPHPSESFLSGANSVYADEMYRIWREDPSKVHSSWATFFKAVDSGVQPGAAFSLPPSAPSGAAGAGAQTAAAAAPRPQRAASVVKPAMTELGYVAADEAANLVHLVRGFQARGHMLARLDPLGLSKPPNPETLDLTPEAFGFSSADLDREINIPDVPGVEGILGGALGTKATLRTVLDALRTTYTGTVGVEYMHIPSREKANFIRSRIERDFSADVLAKQKTWGRFLSTTERERVLSRLHFAEMFETFLAQRWNTAKRFGLEGVESVIPGLKAYIDRSSELGCSGFVIGMPHRGRLNVLANVMRKPLEVIYSEFHGTLVDAAKVYEELEMGYQYTGDVKYHMGTSFKRTYEDGRTISLSLLANPSHLEAVNPLVHGKCRAKMFFENDPTGEKNACILMHGDAAFAGQGVVYESMQLAKLRGYSTGGTLHVIVNNQIGFTTDPIDARSTPYASDLGKAFGCPIFHVNADDPEAVAYIFKVAAEWRQKYLSDVIVDVIGYRRWGHNEMDEARFTQPTMYDVIRKHPTVLSLYSKRVVEDGVFKPEQVDAAKKDAKETLEAAYEKARSDPPKFKEEWLDSKWKGFKSPKQLARIKNTGVPLETLREIGEACFNVEKYPAGFVPHPTVAKVMKDRLTAVRTGQGLDWGTAEFLAYGSLCLEGNHVRLSGQDVQRGTFSHRHAVVHDMKTNAEYSPLNHIRPIGKGPDHQAEFHACNSPLSEFAVSGFELGFSLENPSLLVMWEAQFGDFANGAQVIMDQFISSGETKWLRQSGMVWLLPHGYDGQGPEHSSCRLERFLQLSDEPRDTVPKMKQDERMQIQQSNLQVVNCSTPAQIYHVLRRQVHREFRKPLIVATPKYLLRLKECVSPLEDFGPDSRFKRFIFETDDRVKATDEKKVRKVIFCSGKIYYELAKKREQVKAFDVAICRIEQIAPFPYDRIAEAVRQYPNAQLVYVQEEPQNMGAWIYVDDRIYTATRVLLGNGMRCEYVGRRAFASPAAGYAKLHEIEQRAILDKALE